MRIVEVRSPEAVARLTPQWSALLRDSDSDSVFLTPEWFEAWWASYAAEGEEPLLLAVYDDAGTLQGLAPLRARNQRRYGQTVRTLSFAVDGSNDSEYLDCIVSRSPAGDAAREAIRTRLERECGAGTVLLLNEVPAVSTNLPSLLSMPTAAIAITKDVPCAVAPLPAGFDEYLRGLKPRFRTKVRSVLRSLESQVQFGWCRTMEETERLLPRLFDLHARRWATEGKPGVFGWDRKRAFYFHLSRLLLDRGWLRMSWLEWNGTVLAVQYGFVYNGSYLHLQEGYEPASEHWNVGAGLRAWSIRELIGEGIGEYDFLGGVNRHKTDWGAVTKLSKNVQLASGGLRNRIFCCGSDWERRGRDAMPESLLAMRRALRSRQGGDWARNTAAMLYVNTGLGAISGPLRRRYWLTTKPRLALERRTGPAARILYYHRVNDDRDPFFPAMTRELFAAQMEYVARHYTIVSLGELVNRLEDNGTAEPLMAITFDDGYLDNFTNAFPVLERLGLPATIFLTTGALDSGEPMWFEQLAGALKSTRLESIDLEIDVPRRLTLQSQGERLAANEVIYSVLRRFPNSERKQQLERIVAELGGAPPRPREAGMLGWDDVRRMSNRRIDFGGHTVTHPFLSRLSEAEVLWEAAECKRRIEAELQRPVLHFAYPSGREDDFGLWNKEVIRAAGYQAAVTTIWGVNDDRTDRMELRRGQPWEESPDMFAYKLDWYQLVNG